MTIRVILADDEPLIIKGLRKLIAWDQLDMEIVGQAYDGRELMEAIEVNHPDIIISDISMPHMTGIEMIKEVNRRALPLKVIFISAYQEFSYAKDAIAFGAVDYLVKPLVKKELEHALSKAVSLISQEGEEERRKDKLELLEKRDQDEEMQEWFVRLTDGALSAEGEAYQLLRSEFVGSMHSIGIVELDRSHDAAGRWPGQEQKLVEFAVRNILNELITAFGQGKVFHKNNQHVFVISHDRPEDAAALAEEMKEKILSYLKLTVSIGVGRPVADIGVLANSYREAQQALLTKYFIGLNRVIIHSEDHLNLSGENELYAIRAEVIEGLISNAWDLASHAMERLLVSIGSATFGNPALAVSTCFSSVFSIIQEVKNSGVKISGGGFDIHDLQARLDKFDTFEEMKLGILTILQELHHRIDDKAGNKEKLLMSRIKLYIDEHYAEEVSLENVASIAFMNPYYFSSFFKKHMKQNFKQYLTEVRMKHAVRLLNTTTMMIYEVAESVGYNNARHFSDMFKKLHGKLPQEFRQTNKS